MKRCADEFAEVGRRGARDGFFPRISDPLGEKVKQLKTPPPLFFVSVASKWLSSAVSLLSATLAGRSISVAAKGLTGADCWRESN